MPSALTAVASAAGACIGGKRLRLPSRARTLAGAQAALLGSRAGLFPACAQRYAAGGGLWVCGRRLVAARRQASEGALVSPSLPPLSSCPLPWSVCVVCCVRSGGELLHAAPRGGRERRDQGPGRREGGGGERVREAVQRAVSAYVG
eukprot:scaffold51426_cov28-Tisochrysis_lutea.AAC.2